MPNMFIRCCDIIRSCTNQKQLDTAYKYVKLAFPYGFRSHRENLQPFCTLEHYIKQRKVELQNA